MAQYNTPAYRRFVTCQELGHDFGLDHQDEVFDNPNLGSCMDYTNDPDGGAGGASATDPSNEHYPTRALRRWLSFRVRPTTWEHQSDTTSTDGRMFSRSRRA